MRPGRVRLHLGCGLVHRPGWVNLDRHAGDAADLLGDAGLLPFPDGCAEAVEARQLIEHLGYAGTLYALHEWARVLIPGGTLLVETPDRPSTLEAAATGEHELTLPWLFGTEQRGLDHRYLFAGDELQRLALEVGFADVRIEVCVDAGVDAVTARAARPVLRLTTRRAADTPAIRFGARAHRAFVTAGVLDPLDVPPYMATLETVCERAAELLRSLPPGAETLVQLVGLSARYSPRVSGCILRSLPDPAAWPAAELAQAIDLVAALEAERFPARLACRWRQLPKLPAAAGATWARLEREITLYLTARLFPHDGLDGVREDFEASTAELGRSDLDVAFFCREALTDAARRLSAQGVRAFGRGDLAAGGRALKMALDYDPDLFWPRWNLARVYLCQGRRLDALASYEAVQANLPAGLGRAFEREMDAVCGRGGSLDQFKVPLPDPAELYV